MVQHLFIALVLIRASISGTWEYDEHTEILTLDMITPGFGKEKEYRETIQVRMTGREVGELHGQDLSGRTYVIKRLPGSELKNSLLLLDRLLDSFAAGEMTSATFGKEINKVVASIDALREHRNSLDQLGDTALCEHFDHICSKGGGFKQVLESDVEFTTKKVFTKLLAEGIRKTHLQKLFSECFPDG